MARKTLPSQDLVRQLLEYNPASGVFTWRNRPREMFISKRGFAVWNAQHAGKPAGSVRPNGYFDIVIGHTLYRAHRIAWLYMRGEPVPDIVDHADRNPLNNRIANLRAATPAQSSAHQKINITSKTGVKGVRRAHQRFGFHARINFGGKHVNLGTFATIEEAAKAYQDAAIRLYGEFARWD